MQTSNLLNLMEQEETLLVCQTKASDTNLQIKTVFYT